MNVNTSFGSIVVDLIGSGESARAVWFGTLVIPTNNTVTASGEARNDGTGWDDTKGPGRRSIRVDPEDSVTATELTSIADEVLSKLDASVPFGGSDVTGTISAGDRMKIANLRTALDQAQDRVAQIRAEIDALLA